MATSKNSPTPGETQGDPTLDASSAPGLLPNIEPVSVVNPVDGNLDPAAAEPEPEQDVHLKDISGVRYVGSSDAHSLRVSDLAAVGVEAKRDLRWDRSNNKFVPKSEFNAATLDWLLQDPASFRAE